MVSGGKGKSRRDCFKVGDESVVVGIEEVVVFVVCGLRDGNEGEGGIVREWAGR